MTIKKLLCYSCVLVYILLPLLPVSAGTTGKIVGSVTDAKTGEPLPGVNIIVEGTTLGAATNTKGDYMILNVTPGVYSLRASMIGYTPMVVQQARVTLDLTTTVNFPLTSTVIELEEVVTVTAERPLIQKDVTSSVNIVNQDLIETMPVEDYTEVLALNPGITRDFRGFHLRGGREREVVFEVDGIPVQEPNYGTSYSGISVLSLNNTAISEMVVQSGGFNAEYGNAQSGVVNIITREGGETFHGSLNAETELDLDEGKKGRDYHTGFRKYRLNLSGPVPHLPQLKYFLSTEIITADDGFPSRERTPSELNELNVTGKLTYQMTPQIKLTLSSVFSDKEYSLYDVRRKPFPDTFQLRDTNVKNFSVNFNHALSHDTYYNVLLGYSRTHYNAAQRDKRYDITQSWDWNTYSGSGDTLFSHWAIDTRDTITVLRGDTLELMRDNNLFRYSEMITYLGEANITKQAGKHHQFKGGLEIHVYDVEYEAVWYFAALPFTYCYGLGQDELFLPDIKPKSYSIYVQDKMEFEGVIANVGLRFDAFDPDAEIPSDSYRPYYDFPPTGPPTPTTPDTFWVGPEKDIPTPRDWVRASTKYSISPRLGVSHPVTDRDKLHFTYGHYHQMPEFYLLYRNYNYSYDIWALGPNADLKPEKTVSYEIGVEHLLSDSWLVNVTAFFKDIDNLVEEYLANDPRDPEFQEAMEDSTDPPLDWPYWYIADNAAWGKVKGLEFYLLKQASPRDHISLNLSYTYMIARGKSSNYHEGFLRDLRNEVPPVKDFYLDWDQRHTVSLNLDYRVPGNYGLSLLFRYGSGTPYTGYTGWFGESRSPVENNERLPETFTVDLKLNKMFRVSSNMSANVYILVDNLLDRENVYRFDDTNILIPMVEYLHETGDFSGPYDDPTVFGSHREIKGGVSFSW
ncbi:MAG: TonB-dependent receptor [Gemmatimonadota bacterium]|nr:MAG: TonB-dependent receptor [Gemmatimonadota bacterium]